MKRFARIFAKWYWHDASQSYRLQYTRFGRERATVWPNGTWHTWDKNGCGGENGTPAFSGQPIWQSKIQAYVACVRQGFI